MATAASLILRGKRHSSFAVLLRRTDPKYHTVNISTSDGGAFTGYVESEDATTVTLRLGAEMIQKIEKKSITTRDTVKASAMPDGLAATMSERDFVDLLEFLAAQKQR